MLAASRLSARLRLRSLRDHTVALTNLAASLKPAHDLKDLSQSVPLTSVVVAIYKERVLVLEQPPAGRVLGRQPLEQCLPVTHDSLSRMTPPSSRYLEGDDRAAA